MSILIDRKIVLNESGDFTEEYLDGRLHLVVNGVGIAEGVWYGSEGGVYYPADELRASDPAWDHKPAVYKHPKDANGVPVSAANPAVLNSSRVGLLMNTVTGDDTKQRYKVWIDVDKANSVDARIVQNVRAKTKIEVSTGMVAELVKKKGVWNGKSYDFVAKNIKPDHLAILLDEPGAYSVADGGGLLANAAGLEDEAKAFLLPGIRSWLMNTGILTTNGSLEETKYKLARLLATTYGVPGESWCGYVEATFEDKVVFSKDYRSGYFLVGYKVTKDGVELVGDAVQVQSVNGYRSPDGSVMLANSSGTTETSTSENDMTLQEHVNALITNGQFAESDREWLTGLKEGAQKIKLVPKQTAAVPVLNTAAAPPPAPAAAVPQTDFSGFLAGLEKVNPDMAYVLNKAASEVVSTKATLINTITASPTNPFTKEWLNTQSMPVLEGMAKLAASASVPVHNVAGQVPMFLLQNGGNPNSRPVHVEEALVAPDIEASYAPAKQ